VRAQPEQKFSHYPAWPGPRGIMLPTLPAHPCPYLPDQTAQLRGGLVRRMDGALYQDFMDAGCRRSGRFVYQPACPKCRACVPVRVDVNRFVPRKAHRRCLKRNADLQVSIGTPNLTDEKVALYREYQHWRHNEPDARREQLYEFLYDSPTDTVEFEYRDASGALLGVGICDLTPNASSSVYFFYAPDAKSRGIGIFSALNEIEHSRESGRSFYYLGYWVEGCERMAYKVTFGACDVLTTDGRWRSQDFGPRTC
jgi:arginine-tRNA-protein transferase